MTVKLQFDAEDSRALLSIDRINKSLTRLGLSANNTQTQFSKVGNISTAKAVTQLDRMEQSLSQIENTTTSVTKGFKNLAIAATAFAGITFSFKGLLDAGNNLTKLENRLSLFAERGDDLERVKNELKNISLQAGVAVDATADMFSRFSMSRLGKLYDTDTLLKITDAISATAGMTGGGPSVDAALVQLSQAFSNNFSAAAAELNSINEQAPAVARLIADGLSEVMNQDITSDMLKMMAEEKMLSSELVAQAVLTQTSKVEERVKSMTISLSKGLNAVNIGFSSYLGEFDKIFGISSGIGKALFVFGAFLTGASTGIRKDLDSLISALTPAIDVFYDIQAILSVLVFEPAVNSFKAMVEGVGYWSNQLLSMVTAPLQRFWDFVATLFYTLRKYVVGNSEYKDMILGVVDWTNQLWGLVKGGYARFSSGVVSVFNSISDIVSSIFGKAKTKGVDLYNTIKEYFSFNFNTSTFFLRIKLNLQKTFNKILVPIKAVYLNFQKQLQKIFKQASEGDFEKASESILNFDFSSARLIVVAAKVFFKNLFDGVKSVILKQTANFKNFLSNTSNPGEYFSSSLISSFSTGFNKVKTYLQSFNVSVSSIYKKAISSFNNNINSFADTVSNIFSVRFSDVLLVSLLGGVALASTNARAVLAGAFKRLIFLSLLPLLNNTAITSTISLWTESLVSYIFSGINENLTRLSAKNTTNIANALFVNAKPDETTIQLFSRTIANVLNSIGGAVAGTFATAISNDQKVGEQAGKDFGVGVGQALGVGIAAALFGPVRSLISKTLGLVFIQELSGTQQRFLDGLFGSASYTSTGNAARDARLAAAVSARIRSSLSLVGRFTGLTLGFNLGDIVADIIGFDPNSLETLGVKVGTAIVGAIAGGILFASGFTRLENSANSLLLRLGAFLTGAPAAAAVGTLAARAILRSLSSALLVNQLAFSGVGQALIKSFADSIVRGSGQYSNIIAAALTGAVFVGPALTRGLVANFGRLGSVGLAALLISFSDRTAIERGIKSLGIDFIWADSLVEGIVGYITLRGAGISKRIAGALATALSVSDAIEDANEGSKAAEAFGGFVEGALVGLVITKNPYAAIGAGIANGIYSALDEETQNKLLNWGSNVASYIDDALSDLSIDSISSVMLTGFDKLGNTIDNVISSVKNLIDNTLVLLGLRDPRLRKVSEVESASDYVNSRDTTKLLVDQKRAEVESLDAAVQSAPMGTKERNNLTLELMDAKNQLRLLERAYEDYFTSDEGLNWLSVLTIFERQAKIESDKRQAAVEEAVKGLAGFNSVSIPAIQPVVDQSRSFIDSDPVPRISAIIREIEDKRKRAENASSPEFAATINANIAELEVELASLQRDAEAFSGYIPVVESLTGEILTLEKQVAGAQGDFQIKLDQFNRDVANGSAGYKDSALAAQEAANTFLAVSGKLDLLISSLGRNLNRANSESGANLPTQTTSGTPFANGGYISGPGGPKDDKIPAMLSNGEYVVKASSVKKFGPSFLNSINSGKMPGFANGGLVGESYSLSGLMENFGLTSPLRKGGYLSALLFGAKSSGSALDLLITDLFNSAKGTTRASNLFTGKADKPVYDTIKGSLLSAIEGAIIGMGLGTIAGSPGVGTILGLMASSANSVLEAGQGASIGFRQLGLYNDSPSYLNNALAAFEQGATWSDLKNYLLSGPKEALNSVTGWSGGKLVEFKNWLSGNTPKFAEGGYVTLQRSFENEIKSVQKDYDSAGHPLRLDKRIKSGSFRGFFTPSSKFAGSPFGQDYAKIQVPNYSLENKNPQDIAIAYHELGHAVDFTNDLYKNNNNALSAASDFVSSYRESKLEEEVFANNYMLGKVDSLGFIESGKKAAKTSMLSYVIDELFNESESNLLSNDNFPNTDAVQSLNLAGFSKDSGLKNFISALRTESGLLGLEAGNIVKKSSNFSELKDWLGKDSSKLSSLKEMASNLLNDTDLTEISSSLVNDIKGYIPKFANGGYISGPGGPKSDSIPAMLSNGEYVINAASTKKFLPLLQSINSGAYGAFANGSLVGPNSIGSSPSSPNLPYEIDINLSIDENRENIEVSSRLSQVEGRLNSLGYELTEAGMDAVANKNYDAPRLGALQGDEQWLRGYIRALEALGTITERTTVDQEALNGQLSATSDATSEANKKLKDLKEALERIGEAARDMTRMDQAYFADKGLQGAQAARGSFIDATSGLMSGQLSGKDAVDSILDTLSMQVINTFSESFINSIFNKFDLTSVFGSLFSGVSQTGALAGGNALDPGNLMKGGTPVWILNPGFGAGGTTLPTTEGGAAADPAAGPMAGFTGWLQKLFSGFGEFFKSIFSQLSNLFSGLGGGGSGKGNFLMNILGAFSGNMGGSSLAPKTSLRPMARPFATGGYVAGPGGPKSDSILAALSNGEYVVNAATTKRWLPFLQQLNDNNGRLPAFASGGMVGPSNPEAMKTITSTNPRTKQEQVFNINITGDVSMQTRKEIAKMIPEITSGVNMTNRERGSR